MPTNENFFSSERLQDIAVGIGRGLQSFDPRNPFFNSAGAAMEASAGGQILRDRRAEDRQQRQEDLAAIEQKQKDAEARSEERQLESEQRSEDRQIASEKRQEESHARQMDALAGVVDRGTDTGKRKATNAKFSLDFMSLMGDQVLIAMGKAPIDPYEMDYERDRLLEGKRRGHEFSTLRDRPPPKKAKPQRSGFDHRTWSWIKTENVE